MSASPRKVRPARRSQRQLAQPFLPLHQDVVEHIIRHVGPHLNRLAGTSRQLKLWCEPFLKNLHEIDFRLNRLNFDPDTGDAEPGLRVRNVGVTFELIKTRHLDMTHYHAGQTLALLAAEISNTEKPAEPQLEELQGTWRNIPILALQMQPEQTAMVLANADKPDGKGMDWLPADSLEKSLASFALRDPVRANIVRCAWRARTLEAGGRATVLQWKELLRTALQSAPLPSWLTVMLVEVKACCNLAWHADLPWITLLGATPEPARACISFIEGLGRTMQDRLYLDVVKENPGAPLAMCLNLVKVCPTACDRADIIEAIFETIVPQVRGQAQQEVMALLKEMFALPEPMQGKPASALLAVLLTPKNLAIFLAQHGQERVVQLLDIVCRLEKPKKNVLYRAVLIAQQLPGTDFRALLEKLVTPARQYAPELQAEVWSKLAACLDKLDKPGARQLLYVLTGWQAKLFPFETVKAKLARLLAVAVECLRGHQRQDALLLLVEFLPDELMEKLQSLLLNLPNAVDDFQMAFSFSPHPYFTNHVLDKSLCRDLWQTALVYQAKKSSSSQSNTKRDVWSKPLWIMQTLCILLTRLKYAEIYPAKLFDLLVKAAAQAPRELLRPMVEELCGAAHKGGEKAQSKVLDLILGMPANQHAELLTCLARKLMENTVKEKSRGKLEEILRAAESRGISREQFLVDVVPDHFVSNQERLQRRIPLLLSYVNDTKRNMAFRTRLLKKMIHGWQGTGRSFVYTNLDGAPERREYELMLKSVQKLSAEARPELLLALANKIGLLFRPDQPKVVPALRAMAACISKECEQQVESILREHMRPDQYLKL